MHKPRKMNCLWLIVLLASFVTGLQPLRNSLDDMTATATVTVEESLFQKIFVELTPIINVEALQLVIPGETSQYFSFGDIHLSAFHLGSVAIVFAPPNEAAIELDQLSATVALTQFHVYDKQLPIPISCSGHFWANLDPSTMSVTMAFTSTPSGKVVFSYTNSTVSLGALTVNHTMDTTSCTIADDIIEKIIGNLNNIIANFITTEIPKMIGPIVQNVTNDIFSLLPLRVVAFPVATKDNITMQVNLIPVISSDGEKSSRLAAKAKKVGDAAENDITVSTTAESVSNLLTWMQQQEGLSFNYTLPVNTSFFIKILPAVFSLCPECPMFLNATLPAPVSIAFLEGGNVTVSSSDVSLSVGARAPNGEALDFLSLDLDIVFVVSNLHVAQGTPNLLRFEADVPMLQVHVAQCTLGPLSDQEATVLFNAIVQMVLPIFNQNFKGIALPTLIDDCDVTVSDDNIVLALDINIP